ncbi:MAG TPA: aldose epimerase family protein [Steroidobacteraceae bacterium]|nr:aldose epimerase family protein [Steroidobacteraceae bacterium]
MKLFGTLPDGSAVNIVTLKTSKLELTFTEYGGRVISLKTPDRGGKNGDVILGYDTLNEYLKEGAFFGALIGRFGNRIASGKFSLNGRNYQLPQNDGSNCLHSGPGYHSRVWHVDASTLTDTSATLHYLSRDGEDGYPGNLNIKVRYSLTDTDWRIDYEATTDASTVINLTQHAYFNLGGAGHATILDHELTLHADKFTPVNSNLIPTGELRSVAGTPFDFRQPHRVRERIDQDDEQLKFGRGYDHNWVLNNQNGSLAFAGEISEPGTGRVMQILTTEPGMQFYAGNFMDGAMTGKQGQRYPWRSGFCLETQHYPDSPNQPGFPPTTLNPGQTYRSTTIYRFTAK